MKKHHLVPLLGSNHLKYGVIATTLVLLTLFVNLSAYLVTSTEEPYNPTFQVKSGDDVGLTISGNDGSDSVYPGDSINLSPEVSNTGSIPLYVFTTIDLGGLELEGDISTDWHYLTDYESVPLYYYGGTGSVAALSTSSTIFTTATVPTNAIAEAEFSPSIVAYGIQTENITGTPEEIWEEIVGQQGGN